MSRVVPELFLFGARPPQPLELLTCSERRTHHLLISRLKSSICWSAMVGRLNSSSPYRQTELIIAVSAGWARGSRRLPVRPSSSSPDRVRCSESPGVVRRSSSCALALGPGAGSWVVSVPQLLRRVALSLRRQMGGFSPTGWVRRCVQEARSVCLGGRVGGPGGAVGSALAKALSRRRSSSCCDALGPEAMHGRARSRNVTVSQRWARSVSQLRVVHGARAHVRVQSQWDSVARSAQGCARGRVRGCGGVVGCGGVAARWRRTQPAAQLVLLTSARAEHALRRARPYSPSVAPSRPMCRALRTDQVAIVTEATPIDKPAVATKEAANAEPPTGRKARLTDEDNHPTYYVTPGKILSLSSQERPALLVSLFMRIASEGTGMVIPLVLAAAYDKVVEGYGDPDEAAATRDTVSRVFILVLFLHVGGNVFGFLAGCATSVAGERVVSTTPTENVGQPRCSSGADGARS